MGTYACVAEFGSEWTNGFKGIRLEGLKLNSPPCRITNPPYYLPCDNLWYQYNCRARWLTQNEAVNVEIMHTIGLDREVYAQEETKEIDGVKKKKPMHA